MNFCNVLRDAELSYGDYLEQLTFLIFLKMLRERAESPFTLLPSYQTPPLPPGDAAFPNQCCRQGYDWPSLLRLGGDALEAHYRHILEKLG